MDHFKLSFYCYVNKYDGRHTHKIYDESGQYAVDCCNESLCNNQGRNSIYLTLGKSSRKLSRK